MEEWKQRLYNSYVSTEQAGQNIDRAYLDKGNYPYLARLIKKHLPGKKDISIADMACGHGRLIYCLKKYGYHNIQGVDISAEQVELAHEFGLMEVKCQSIESFLDGKKDAYDVLLLIDILEHLDKGQLFVLLDLVNNSLGHKGIVVIHVPNAEGIFGGKIRYSDFTHENSFTTQSMTQILTACGFKNIKCLEDKPVVHGLKSLIRFVLWQILTLPYRLLMAAETGVTKCILSQNMLVIAETNKRKESQ